MGAIGALPPPRRVTPSVYPLLGLLALTGSYLAGAHWMDARVACPNQGLVDCTAVLSGPGSVVLGLPLAAWGSLWALLGMGLLSRTGWMRRGWQALGGMGLLWAWAHELADRHVCLWCSGIQLGIVAVLILSQDWTAFRAGWQGLWPRPVRRPAALAGGMAAMGLMGVSLWHPVGPWVLTGLWAIAWGGIGAWGTAILTRRARPRWTAWTSVGLGSTPWLVGTGVAACAGGVCTAGVSVLGTSGSVGLAGLLGVLAPVAPLAAQGALLIASGLALGWVTARIGRAATHAEGKKEVDGA